MRKHTARKDIKNLGGPLAIVRRLLHERWRAWEKFNDEIPGTYMHNMEVSYWLYAALLDDLDKKPINDPVGWFNNAPPVRIDGHEVRPNTNIRNGLKHVFKTVTFG